MAEHTADAAGARVHDHGHDHDHEHDHGGGCGIPKFDSRDLVIRADIMAKAKELAEMIYTSDEVQHYRRAEAQIKANEKVQSIIAQIKKKQKEIVAFEKFQNPAMVKKIEAEIEALQDELDRMPIVADFQQSQSDINYLLQLVVSVIRDTVAKKLDVEGASAPEAPAECSD
jgi:cell fate (sporulation/competence/biofilm development) regulator YmcA (YheA/YmcA/DUF963 family)